MALMSYAEFKGKYQHGYGLSTSTKLKDAYREYQLHGTLPTGAAPIEEEAVEAVGEAVVEPTAPTAEEAAWQPTAPTSEEQIAGMPTMPTLKPPTLAPIPEVTPAPTFEAPEVPPIPEVTPAPTIAPIEVVPAPEYVTTEEEAAWAEMYGGTIADIIKARGEGIPEETINLMIRQNTQALQSREDENMRLMHNDMERRGITNSGLVFWNQQKIKSATTVGIANSITDIQIKSALMKMASFENALGQAGQFLGYLQEQSKMIYAGKMATWEAQTQADLIQYQAQISADMDQWKMVNQFNLADWQTNTQALFAQWDKNTTAVIENWKMKNQFSIAEWETQANYNMAVFKIKTEATMARWSAQTDIYKMGINQAYMQDNMNLQGQIDAAAAEQQNIWDVEMEEMKAEAANQAAGVAGFWNIVGIFAGSI